MLFKANKVVASLLALALTVSGNTFAFASQESTNSTTVQSSSVLGDVNNDTKIDVKDVSSTLNYVLSPSSVADFNTTAVDVNGDGVINSEDVALILQKVLNSSFKFPAEPENTTTAVTNWKEFKTAAATAKAGDTISLSNDITADGTAIVDIDGVSGATLVVKEKNVTILGNGHTVKSDGTNTFTFDFDGEATENNGGATGVNVNDLTIDGASFKAKIGGGMFLEYGAEVTLNNVTMKNCNAGNAGAFNGGGAIYVNNHRGEAPTLTANNCTFENNTSGDGTTGRGGAIYGSTGNVVLNGCTFKNNKAAFGGAIAMDGKLNDTGVDYSCSLSVTDCTFVNNDGVYGGDDIYIYEGDSAGKKNMTVTSNIEVKNISGCTFSGETTNNFADYDVVYSRYYSDTYGGDKTKAAPKFDGVNVHDVTFPTIDRNTLEVVTTTEATTETTTTTVTTTETTTEVTTEATTEVVTNSYSGSATVDVFGYIAKVKVITDSLGKIISVTDDNTDPSFSADYWELGTNMFNNFVGKTVNDLDNVDGVSGATLSSNAIRKAVKSALSSAKVSLTSNFVEGEEVNANNAVVELALTSNNNADIYYTTDGSQPTVNGTKYVGPITFDVNNVTLSQEATLAKKVVD